MTTRRPGPKSIRRRIADLAGKLANETGEPDDLCAADAVLLDVIAGAGRTPLDVCEHNPPLDGSVPVLLDATTRLVRCSQCDPATLLPEMPDEQLARQDLWCDICTADTGRPLADGGGLAARAVPFNSLHLVVWFCIDCEPFFDAVTELLKPVTVDLGEGGE